MSAEREDMSRAALPWPRLFYWQVRREIWEHRGVYLAPLAAAGAALVGFVLSLGHLPAALKAAVADPKKVEHLMLPYDFVAVAVLVTGLIFAIFYSLGALHGERRDRSILFWKSLPVSDLTTVLSKAFVPLGLLPPVIFAAVFAGSLVVLALSTATVLLTGGDPVQLWSRLDLVFMWLALGNGLVFMFLWWAPVVAWLMLVSAWARRMTFLWAVGPFLAVMVIERIAVGKPLIFYHFLRQRLAGAFAQAFTVGGQGKVFFRTPSDLDLGRMYSSPELWIGLAVAAAFLALAVRLRRSSHPI